MRAGAQHTTPRRRLGPPGAWGRGRPFFCWRFAGIALDGDYERMHALSSKKRSTPSRSSSPPGAAASRRGFRGSGVNLDSWRLFETEGIHMGDGDQAVVSAPTAYVDDTRSLRRAARIRQRHDWGSTSSASCLQQIARSRPGVVYERFPMLCDLDGCQMWLGDRKNQLPTTLTAEDEPRRNFQAKKSWQPCSRQGSGPRSRWDRGSSRRRCRATGGTRRDFHHIVAAAGPASAK